ncbi:hypothetical protein E3Q16_01084 [Wallemia mellicola]|nr:hypothetical protein E3Q16_01084 [Wallemia mellicola]
MATIDPTLTQNELTETQESLNDSMANPPVDPTLDPPEESNDRLNEELSQFPDFSRSQANNEEEARQQSEKKSAEKKRHQKKRIQRRDESPEYDSSHQPPIEQEEDNSQFLEPSQQKRLDLHSKIDAIAKGNKNSRRKRKRTDEDLDAAADEELHNLREQMFQAAEEDEEYKKFNKPALNKLKLLPKVVETMQKTHLETSILENNFLDGVRRWLEPFSDKSLPPLNIQTEFFQILSNMYIDTQSLKSSKLGPVILFYSRHPRVNKSIKKAADALVTRWMRPLLRRSANPRSYQFSTNSNVVRTSDVNLTSREDNEEDYSNRTRIPELERKKYRVAATRGVDGIKSSNVTLSNQESERQRQLSRKFSMLKRK